MSVVLPGGLIKEHDRWIVNQFQGNGQSFTLAPRERDGTCLSTLLKAQSGQDLVHLEPKQREVLERHGALTQS